MTYARSAWSENTKAYLALVRRFPLKPIRTEEENNQAAEICDKLLARFDELTATEKDYFEVLSDLIGHFEEQWQEENNIEPRKLLLFLMEQNNLNQTDLIPIFGTSSRVSEYLNGKRELSLNQIQKLSARFNLSPAAFISSLC